MQPSAPPTVRAPRLAGHYALVTGAAPSRANSLA